MLMFTPVGAAHLGAASAAISDLQNALVGLAQASGRPAINPGKVDGVLGSATMGAVAAALQILSEKTKNDTVILALSAALIFGATSTQAKNAVTSYAPQLTMSIRAATAGYASGLIPNPTAQILTANVSLLPGATGTLTVATAPWYKQWWGIAGIALAAYLAYRYLTAPEKAA